MTPNIILASVLGFFGTVSTLILGYFKYKTDREKNKNDLTTSVWQQYREDNKTLTTNLENCRKEIRELDDKIEKALEAVKQHKADKEKAEEQCELQTKRADAAEKEAARLQCLYDGEHAACSLFRHLYDDLVEGRSPDAAMLASIQTRLLDLATPATAACAP